MAIVGALAIGLGIAACGSSSSADTSGPVDIVAYSTPETVYKDGLIPAFKKTSQGASASFSTSFGPSGDQSRAVESGQPASVVHFSIQPDMQRLVDSGQVDSNWDQNPEHGFVQDSVVVFVVRQGNPDNIQSWDDLVKPGVEVLTPNPFSSGGARWNLMAAYGSQIEEGKSDAQAQEYLKQLLGNVALQAPSASDSMTAFTQGKGDVALAYENEAIAAQKAGEKVDYVVPDDTILIQTPIAVTKDAPEAAQKFLDFVWSGAGQQIWADNGYRPVDPKLVDPKKFPTPKDLFTIDQFGGWDKVNDEFFDDTTGKVAEIEKELGVSTAG